MTKVRFFACLAILMLAQNAFADDDCDDPVGEWQAQGKLRQMLEGHQWTVRRIKVDDGCYEVYGVDKSGNRFEAKYFPASLQLRALEIEFEQGANADIADYLDKKPLPEGAVPDVNGIHRDVSRTH